MTKYKQLKEKACLPVIYTKMIITYILAYITKAKPKWRKNPSCITFSTGKENTIFLLLTPIIILILFMIGFIIQMPGDFWYIWVSPLLYLCFSFDYIWLSGDEELLLSKSIEKITKGEQREKLEQMMKDDENSGIYNEKEQEKENDINTKE